MEKKKSLNVFKRVLMVLLIVPCVLIFSACSLFGSSNGKSAYEIAVENGFEGTEKQWIESLQGKNGQDGQTEKINLYDIYIEACERDGYTGSYVDFVKEFYTDFDSNSDATSLIANECTMSVCEVYAYSSYPTSNAQSKSGGSGVIYSMDNDGNAYIITNYHVTYYGANMLGDLNYGYYALYFYGANQAVVATFVGGSKKYDISILKVERSQLLLEMGCKPVTIREESAHLAESVIAIGNARGLGVQVTTGVVSVDSNDVRMTVGGVTQLHRLIRFDAFIEHGSSGGALFDAFGNLIGITNGGDEGYLINYAIPANVVTAVADKVIANCNGSSIISINRCYLGVSTSAVNMLPHYDANKGYVDVTCDVRIASITENGLAQSAGLKVGDIIKTVTFRGQTIDITKNYHLDELMLKAVPGDELTITVSRPGSSLPVSVDILLTTTCYSAVDA